MPHLFPLLNLSVLPLKQINYEKGQATVISFGSFWHHGRCRVLGRRVSGRALETWGWCICSEQIMMVFLLMDHSVCRKKNTNSGSITPGGGPAGQILSPSLHGQVFLLHVIILTFELDPRDPDGTSRVWTKGRAAFVARRGSGECERRTQIVFKQEFKQMPRYTPFSCLLEF